MSGALDGIRVLEFASYVAGPYAGMILGDMGAEVIKVENPEGGDPFRGWGDKKTSPIFEALNRNKKSITADLKSTMDLDKIIKLASTADVLIQNFRSGILSRAGLGYDDLARVNSRLVYCSISGFGEDGPYSGRPGYDTIGQAMGGLMSLMTDLSNPKPVGYSFSDHFAGMAATQAILAALFSRERSGRGQFVDTSLLQATISMVGENASRYFFDNEVPNRESRVHLAQVYAFIDKEGLPFVIHLSSPEKFWKGLLKAINREELAKDPRFRERNLRIKNSEILRETLASTFKNGSRRNWLETLLKNDVPAGPINTLAEVFEDPQVEKLGLKANISHPLMGKLELVRSGFNLAETPLELRSRAPNLGEHNSEIFK